MDLSIIEGRWPLPLCQFVSRANFDAYVKEHVSHLKCPICHGLVSVRVRVCSCCLSWEIVALADVSNFIIDCLLI